MNSTECTDQNKNLIRLILIIIFLKEEFKNVFSKNPLVILIVLVFLYAFSFLLIDFTHFMILAVNIYEII